MDSANDAGGTDAFGGQNFQAENGLNTMDLSTAQSIGDLIVPKNSKTDDFIIYHKNTRGLSPDERITELLGELDGLQWDAVTLNETMRTTKQEYWVTNGGHVFMASGFHAHTRGVAILINKKWTNSIKKFHPVSERIAIVDLKHKQIQLRIVSAYFPHSGYGDEDVQEMYDTLSELIKEARDHKLRVVIGADCNAQVGIPDEDENSRSVGQFGMKNCNVRGQWLKSWATTNNMIIANTCFEKPVEKLITFMTPSGVPKQLDYFLVSRRVRAQVKNCEATNELDMNSDHKALKLRVTIKPQRRLQKKKKQKRKGLWPPCNIEQYEEKLTSCLNETLETKGEIKCKHIEDAIQQAMSITGENSEEITTPVPVSHLQSLLHQRREIHLEQRGMRSQYSKQIKKEIRTIKRLERRTQISKILSQYKNLKSIAGIKSQKKKELISSMVSASGEEVYDRQSIANVFANFYEQLYEDKCKTKHIGSNTEERIEDFSSAELGAALKQLKSGKAADANSICAEMLKLGGSKIREVILTCFNDIIRPNGDTPREWHRTLIKVLHKNGDTRLPQNYRPIASIPILYKLFSKMLYNRLEPILDPEQSLDQAGFRRNRTTVDHLFTTVLVQDNADEWRVPVWVAAVDFKKAFDSVTHDALWKSLREQKVPEGYVKLLARMYDEQIGVVSTERLSKEFSIEKGVKQGDPLSSLLFNSASENILRRLKQDWQEGDYGIKISSSAEKLTNLRFADDILLISHSLESISKMIAHLSMESIRSGLALHPDKTKILHNSWTRLKNIPAHVNANGMQIEVLRAEESTKYLGRKLCFSDPHRVELENRISNAWKKFYSLKQELTGKHYSINDRLRLFHGTVTPTVLYGCEAWALSTELENRLQKTQRQMLRMILGVPRRVMHVCPDDGSDVTSNADEETHVESAAESLEPWVDWIRRSTHEAEKRMKELKLEDWVTLHRRRKWRWARKVAASPIPSWSKHALTWEPGHRIQSANYTRRVGRPKLRWTDDIRVHIFRKVYNATVPPSLHARLDNGTWMHHAQDRDLWERLEESFIHRSHNED